MYKYDVSIVVPGIRTGAWRNLYESAVLACGSKSYEMVFVGPNKPDDKFLSNENVKFIEDFGSPNRCQQIGVAHSEGKYITWGSDDAPLTPNTLGRTIEFLDERDEMHAACMKFLESSNPSPSMWGDEYYHVNHSTWTRAPFISDDQLIMNTGVVHEKTFRDIGGFDAELFETTAMAHSDLAIRLTHHGVKIHLVNMIFAHADFSPGDTGDHGPVFAAHHDSDIPKFVATYSKPESLGRCRIDFDNWKRTPSRWTRRFGSGT